MLNFTILLAMLFNYFFISIYKLFIKLKFSTSFKVKDRDFQIFFFFYVRFTSVVIYFIILAANVHNTLKYRHDSPGHVEKYNIVITTKGSFFFPFSLSFIHTHAQRVRILSRHNFLFLFIIFLSLHEKFCLSKKQCLRFKLAFFSDVLNIQSNDFSVSIKRRNTLKRKSQCNFCCKQIKTKCSGSKKKKRNKINHEIINEHEREGIFKT